MPIEQTVQFKTSSENSSNCVTCSQFDMKDYYKSKNCFSVFNKHLLCIVVKFKVFFSFLLINISIQKTLSFIQKIHFYYSKLLINIVIFIKANKSFNLSKKY